MMDLLRNIEVDIKVKNGIRRARIGFIRDIKEFTTCVSVLKNLVLDSYQHLALE